MGEIYQQNPLKRILKIAGQAEFEIIWRKKMGARNGNLMSIFSCSILLCSLLLVMEVLFMSQNIHGMLVSLLRMPFSCIFLLLAVNLIFQGVGMAPNLQLWQSQKMKIVRFFWKLPGRLLTNLFLALVEVGDRSQTALFRSGQYNYHWIHHHFSHNWSWPTWREGSENAVDADVDTTLDYTISHKYAVYCSIYCAHFETFNSCFYQKPPLMTWFLNHLSSLNNFSLVFCVSMCCIPLCSPMNLKTSKLRGASLHRGPGRGTWIFGTAKAGPWSCPAHRQAAGTSKPQGSCECV